VCVCVCVCVRVHLYACVYIKSLCAYVSRRVHVCACGKRVVMHVCTFDAAEFMPVHHFDFSCAHFKSSMANWGGHTMSNACPTKSQINNSKYKRTSAILALQWQRWVIRWNGAELENNSNFSFAFKYSCLWASRKNQIQSLLVTPIMFNGT